MQNKVKVLELMPILFRNSIGMQQMLSLGAALWKGPTAGWTAPLTGWTDDNVIRNGSSTFIPGCTLIHSFIGLCFPFTHDVNYEGS